MKDIYSWIIDNAELTQAHKDELIKKRGFSDATITQYKFRSCGPQFLQLAIKLQEKFRDADLLASRVFIETPKQPTINPILIHPRILIPYLDKTGAPYYLRPHKLGFEGLEIELYCEMNVPDDAAEIIITEGEFKAVAGCQFGVPTIALPGIQSFSDKHYPRLENFLKAHGVKRIYIMFDNEVKDDPAFPDRFKENPNARYDTQVYTYYMAQKLEKSGFDSRIALLPDKWRVNGKIDIDGAAAAGKTSGDIRQCLYDAVSYKEYLKEQTGDCKATMLRKLAAKRHYSHIQREWGHYEALRKRGKTETHEAISNFLMKIVATHETPEGILREMVLIDEHGRQSSAVQIGAEEMVASEKFSAFCANCGDFIWKGTKDDLMAIWESEFLMMDEGRRILEPDHVGWIEQEKTWVFANVAIVDKPKDELKEVRPDKSQTFWMDKRGLRPMAIGAGAAGKSSIPEGLPYINLHPFDVREVLKRLIDTIGEGEAKQIMGWITAVPFMEEIFDRYACFPFLFVTGKRASGKSTIAEWVMNFFGVENSGKMASETTPVALQRYMSYYSCLPFFVDEYRNTEQIKYKTGLLRNAYNRQSAGKGIKDSFGIREAKIRGTLVVAGEETPEDNATLSRIIPIYVAKNRRVENHFKWFTANKGKFSYHLYDIIKRKRFLIDKFFKIVDEAQKYFTDAGREERVAINYAFVAAGYAVGFDENDTNFANFVVAETERFEQEVDEEQPVQTFVNDLTAMRTKGAIDDRYWRVVDDTLYLYFEGLYNEWSQEYRHTRGTVPFKKSAIRAYLKEEPGFLESNRKSYIKDMVKSCMTFKWSECPDPLRMLIGDGVHCPATGEILPR